MPITIQKIAGMYYLHRVRETASGFKLNPDQSFQFFFTYGALDRYGSGSFVLDGDNVVLQSRRWSGKDFALTGSGTSGRGVTLKITDKNPVFQKHVFASLRNGEDGSWQFTDSKGEIHFATDKVSVITLAFELCPERFTFFPVENSDHNYFEFRLEPWILEIFFNNFPLKVKGRVLMGKHPLLRGDEFLYEKA